jgi:hypothetical protein
MVETPDRTSLDALRRMMADNGATRLYAKFLAPNDNNKNQPYFGGDLSSINILPFSTPILDPVHKNLKARLNFAWLDREGRAYPAPNAQLIVYPQYPEVRFSGYLDGCDREHRPSRLLGSRRIPGRVLFLGVGGGDRILGYVVGPESALATEVGALRELEHVGVFVRIPLGDVDDDKTANRRVLLAELCRVSRIGWIGSKRLQSDGSVISYHAPNGGGYTLEAELGVRPNGYSKPDFRGWEVKQHAVSNLDGESSALITLLTPEPSEGFYVSAGVIPFVQRYGYADPVRANRINFGGAFRNGVRVERAKLTMRLLGYDAEKHRIADPSGGIALIGDNGEEAAVWRYADLIDHWKRKHSSAVFVASASRPGPPREYRYSSRVRLGVGTTFDRFIGAIARGVIVYDPGIKVENVSAQPRTKRRSQFRVRSRDLPSLYEVVEEVDACVSSGIPHQLPVG